MHIISSIGDTISKEDVEVFINNFVDYNIITVNEGIIMKAITNDKALIKIPYNKRNAIRADIFKNILVNIAVCSK